MSKQKQKECTFIFKNYTVNQTILSLDMDQFVSETDVAFAVNVLIEAMPQTLFLELKEQLQIEKQD